LAEAVHGPIRDGNFIAGKQQTLTLKLRDSSVKSCASLQELEKTATRSPGRRLAAWCSAASRTAITVLKSWRETSSMKYTMNCDGGVADGAPAASPRSTEKDAISCGFPLSEI
jgi:hypothetical protein